MWDGDEENPILFDLNFLALGITPAEALRLSITGPESLELGLGEWLRNPSFGIEYIREHRLARSYTQSRSVAGIKAR